MCNPECSLQFGLLLELYCRGSGSHIDTLLQQVRNAVVFFVTVVHFFIQLSSLEILNVKQMSFIFGDILHSVHM